MVKIFIFIIVGILGINYCTSSYVFKDIPATEVRDGDILEPRTHKNGKQYHKSQKQRWRLNMEYGFWALVFRKLAVEHSRKCEHDYLEVLEFENGTLDREIPPTRFCGERLPIPYISTRPQLLLTFITDNIWESEGFTLQAVYGENKATLLRKIGMETNKPNTLHLSSQQIHEEKPEDENRKSLFYILVGSSCAALVLFVGLLLYFTLSFRNAEPPITRLPDLDLYCISGSSQNRAPPTSVVISEAGRLLQQSNKKGKRYSRGKTTVHPAPEKTEPESQQRTIGSQHNNLYVLN